MKFPFLACVFVVYLMTLMLLLINDGTFSEPATYGIQRENKVDPIKMLTIEFSVTQHNLTMDHHQNQGTHQSIGTYQRSQRLKTAESLHEKLGKSYNSTYIRNINKSKEIIETQITKDYFATLKQNVVKSCKGNFMGYSSHFVHFKNILLNRSNAQVGAKGGESIHDVIDQKSDAESYQVKQGFHKIHCSVRPKFTFTTKIEHLHSWWKTTVFTDKGNVSNLIENGITTENKFTILLTRYEYANVYWTVVDLYDAFLLSR